MKKTKFLLTILALGVIFVDSARANGPSSCEVAVAQALGLNHKNDGDKQEIQKQAGLIEKLNRLARRRLKPVESSVLQEARAAIPEVKAYLQSLRNSNFERDYVIDAIFRAVLAKKHVLIAGGAGAGKSKVVREALSNIHLPKEIAANVASTPIMVQQKRDITKPYKPEDAMGSGEGPFTSFFQRAFSNETKEAHVFGDPDNGLLFKDGTRRLRLDEGGPNHLFALLDEFLDAPSTLLRGLLTWMNEGVVLEGKRIYQSATNTIIGATNYYLNEAYQAAAAVGIKLEANMDRIGSIIIVPKKFADEADPSGAEGSRERLGSLTYMTRKYADKELGRIDPLDIRRILALQKLWDQVEIPTPVLQLFTRLGEAVDQNLTREEAEAATRYLEAIKNNQTPPPAFRKAKIYSARFYNNGVDALRSFVIMDWLQNPDRPLIANFSDLAAIGPYVVLDGPGQVALNKLLSNPNLPADEVLALQSLQIERKAFLEAWKTIISEFEAEMSRYME